MERSTSPTSQLSHLVIHLLWPVLVAQLVMMANAVIGGFGGFYFQVHHCLACFRGCASGSSG
jgi:hypothetical protein